MKTQARVLRGQRGFTMTELLVVCALMGTVMAGVLSLLVVGQQSATTTAAKQDAQQNARMALERMIEEIREAGYLPAGPSCPGAPAVPCPPFNYVFNAITAQSATTLTIQNDWNGSATITAAAVTDPITGVNRGEQIVYTFTLATGQLTRQEIGIDGAAVIIAAGITNLAFTYLDQDNNVTAAAANIRTVTITITTQQSAGQPSVTMVNRVRLRNRPTA
jgi:prepilin-type N-terminal cleavage/methylation domain-containing protein